MHYLSLRAFRRENLQLEPVCQPCLVKIFFHGESSRQKAYAPQASCPDCCAGGVRNMQEGNVDTLLDFRCHLMHRVGAEKNEIRSSSFQALGRGGQKASRVVPTPLTLHFFYFCEVHRKHEDLCRVQASRSGFYDFIKNPVVLNRRLPAHSANQTYGFHIELLLNKVYGSSWPLGRVHTSRFKPYAKRVNAAMRANFRESVASLVLLQSPQKRGTQPCYVPAFFLAVCFLAGGRGCGFAFLAFFGGRSCASVGNVLDAGDLEMLFSLLVFLLLAGAST